MNVVQQDRRDMAGPGRQLPEFPEQIHKRPAHPVVPDPGRPGVDADDLFAGLREQADRFHRGGILLEDIVGIPDRLPYAFAPEEIPEPGRYDMPPQVVLQFTNREEDHSREVEDLTPEDGRLQPSGAVLHFVCEPG